MQSSGKFEITEGGTFKCSGVIKKMNASNAVFTSKGTGVFQKSELQSLQLDKTGLYQELRLRGYDYGPSFQRVQSYDISGLCFDNLINVICQELYSVML